MASLASIMPGPWLECRCLSGKQVDRWFNTPVVDGAYSLALPNEQNYNVVIQWSGALGSIGTCKGGSLAVGVGAGGNPYLTNKRFSCLAAQP